MLRHIVAWNFKEGFTDEQNRENALKVKSELESLINHIDGLVEIRVFIDQLPSSTRNIVLNSLLRDEEALAVYQAHPEHQRVAAFVASVTRDRVCVDYLE